MALAARRRPSEAEQPPVGKTTVYAVSGRARARWPVVLGLIFYCAACWAVVAVVAESLYQYAAPPQAAAESGRSTSLDRVAR